MVLKTKNSFLVTKFYPSFFMLTKYIKDLTAFNDLLCTVITGGGRLINGFKRQLFFTQCLCVFIM